MKLFILAAALSLVIVTPLFAQITPSAFEVVSNANGNVSENADWYRVAQGNTGSITPNQAAGGSYFIVTRQSVQSFEAAVSQWTRNGANQASLLGNQYEIRFTGETSKAGELFSGNLIDVPFEIWNMGRVVADESDDVRMIPLIVHHEQVGEGGGSDPGVFNFALDHSASSANDDPSSDWMYFFMPQNQTPGEAGYDEFVATGFNSLGSEHLARVVLMNWNRRQNESVPGAGDGPINAMPEVGTVFRLDSRVFPPVCLLTEFTVGSPDMFTMEVVDGDIQSIVQTSVVSATLDIPPFTPGEAGPLTVTGTLQDRANAVVEFEVTDTFGNTTSCSGPRMDEIAIHDAGNVALALQKNSNFGTFGTSFPVGTGLSARWPKVGGVQHLFIGNLFVGTEINGMPRVMDGQFGPFDWSESVGTPVTLSSIISDQDIGLTYDDRNASSPPIGLRVHQQSFAWSDPAREDFIVFKYTFENTGENGDLEDVFPAIWTDTDVGDFSNQAGFDATRGMVYTFDDQGLGGYVGIKVLGGAAHASGAQSGGQFLSDQEKFDAITNGLSIPSGTFDVRMIVTGQPFDLPVGGVHTSVFAMVFGANLAELQANADEMEATYATRLVDDDADGVPSQIESAVPNLDGTGTGDGNGDGIADVDQANVASFPNDVDGTYVTFESEPGTQLIGVIATDSPPEPHNAPASSEFPAGFLSFGVKGVPLGGATTVTIYTNKTVNSYWKFGPTPGNPVDHWYDFTYDGTTGAEFFPDGRIELHIVDGGRGDHDLTADGRIQDPGAPVLFAPEAALGLLTNLVESLDLNYGLKKSLTTKLDNASKALDKVQDNAAVGLLATFIQEVQALSGQAGQSKSKGKGQGNSDPKLSETEATQLVVIAQSIIDQILGVAGKRGPGMEPPFAVENPVESLELTQNYPNPFKERSTIEFGLPESVPVRVVLYDVLGREVHVIDYGVLSAGTHRVQVVAQGLSTGTYFYALETPLGKLTRRMTVIK